MKVMVVHCESTECHWIVHFNIVLCESHLNLNLFMCSHWDTINTLNKIINLSSFLQISVVYILTRVMLTILTNQQGTGAPDQKRHSPWNQSKPVENQPCQPADRKPPSSLWAAQCRQPGRVSPSPNRQPGHVCGGIFLQFCRSHWCSVS